MTDTNQQILDRLYPSAEAIRDQAVHGLAHVAWKLYGRWLRWYREEYPEDDRSDLELIRAYDAFCNPDRE